MNTKGPDSPILNLHSYRLQMMITNLNSIQSIWIEVIHIPAGYSYLCQPLDVEINQCIKSVMGKTSEDWMLEGEGIVNGQAKEPSCNL